MPKRRQAVILIHGMGEPRPMESLAGFVETVLAVDKEDEVGSQGANNKAAPARGEANEDSAPYWNKPDQMSQSFEVRRLRSRNLNGNDDFVETDFYEYYWAHHMEGTVFWHVVGWLDSWKAGRKLFKLSWVLRLLILILFVSIPGYFLFYSWILALFPLGNFLWWIPFVLGVSLLVTMLIGFYDFTVKYLGDAARYINALPVNIKRRQEIRSEGIRLLKRLHYSNKYERIIIVGHSLGSMIAYDILRYAWLAYHRRQKIELLDEYEVYKQKIAELETINTKDNTARIRALQIQMFDAQRRCGNPWKVTDFVTLGSPLYYADIFMTSSQSTFENRINARELPTCPPIKQDGKLSEQIDDDSDTIALHHAALFACTRWTNIYFRTDRIGGDLKPVFGLGIDDKPVGHPVWPIIPLMHTQYWSDKQASKLLREVLQLESFWEGRPQPAAHEAELDISQTMYKQMMQD